MRNGKITLTHIIIIIAIIYAIIDEIRTQIAIHKYINQIKMELNNKK